MAIPTACMYGVILAGLIAASASASEMADVSKSVVVVRHGKIPMGERTAATVLIEEVKKRTGLEWPTATALPKTGCAIEISGGGAKDAKASGPEGYRLFVDRRPERTVVRIHGADARGALYGVGRFLRSMQWGPDSVRIDPGLDIRTKPAYSIRGHQLGYRATANSYDAWDERQYEQYIRELAIFGTNTIENIPFQDADSPVMPVPRERMNIAMSEICERYDMDYWVWTPAEFDLKDTALRTKELDRHEAFYRACPRLDAVFFPGGDPGDNPPQLVMPFLEELAHRLAKHHPKAGVWISLQGFEKDAVDAFYAYLEQHAPKWLTGVVSGPSSPPLVETRRRLPERYKLRLYPDITHTILCQYPIPWWDPAYAFTLGREPINPRPQFYANVCRWSLPHSDGFSTYSDGIHDDVNKMVWSALGWDLGTDLRALLVDYARLFFRPDLAEKAADGILALESNWEGPLPLNGGVEATLELWSQLEARAPELAGNWRWRSCLFRAAYDAFVRGRLRYETQLEDEANRALADAGTRGADGAMDAALAVLKRADTEPACPDLRACIEAHGEALFKQIGFQTSVERYHAKGAERGAVLDFLDRPLNNRWWLEDEFARIRKLPSEDEKRARLDVIRTWECPAPGSLYDDIGNVAKMPHVVRGEGVMTDPEMARTPLQGYGTWMDGGRSRWRLSSLTSMDWPAGVVYEGLDSNAAYIVRLTGQGEALLRVNGQRVEPSLYGKAIGEFKEFPVPKDFLKDGKITLTWDTPSEPGVNWRQQSMLAEVWLIPTDAGSGARK